MDEAEVGVVLDRVKVGEVASVGEGIQYDDAVAWVLRHPVVDEIAADKTSRAGDEEVVGHLGVPSSISMARNCARQ